MSTTTELQTPDRYVFDNAWEHARRRLTLLEQCTDASTIRRLRSLGVQPGWRCLEAGAGAGSIARWLCSQVGPTGRVLAADLDTRFLDHLDVPNLDVQRMDLRSDELPRGSFDLIHARALLVHIPQREQILDGLVAALRPGGVLLLEDADHFPLAALDTGLYAEVFEAFLDSAVRAGIAKDWARHLPTDLQRKRFNVVASQMPLTSFTDDVRAVTRDLGAFDGPTVVVGHSYGGLVITEAASGATNVASLVYVAGGALDTRLNHPRRPLS